MGYTVNIRGNAGGSTPEEAADNERQTIRLLRRAVHGVMLVTGTNDLVATLNSANLGAVDLTDDEFTEGPNVVLDTPADTGPEAVAPEENPA